MDYEKVGHRCAGVLGLWFSEKILVLTSGLFLRNKNLCSPDFLSVLYLLLVSLVGIGVVVGVLRVDYFRGQAG